MMEKREQRNRDGEALSRLIYDMPGIYSGPILSPDPHGGLYYITIVPIPTSQPPTTSLHVNLQ